MDPRQVDLVQQTFALAARAPAHVAASFYRELFAIDPALKPMFSGDMIAQGDKLMRTLEFVVNGLSTPETILPIVRNLGVAHVRYGVKPQHYATVGIALLRTLRHELGADFTPEARAAWTAAYQMLADAMREAAYGPSPPPLQR